MAKTAKTAKIVKSVKKPVKKAAAKVKAPTAAKRSGSARRASAKKGAK